jgi:ribosomal protein S18 acetylase RimI-like enzyme
MKMGFPLPRGAGTVDFAAIMSLAAPMSGVPGSVPREPGVTTLTHRRATRADCRLLGALNHQLIRDEGHRNPMTEAQLAQRMRRWLARGEYRAELFEERGEVVAYALYREAVDEIYLRHLFVARNRRRQGLGRRVMRLLFDEIWPRGRRLTVEVLCANTAGVAFWKAMGYREYSLGLEIMPPPQSMAAAGVSKSRRVLARLGF